MSFQGNHSGESNSVIDNFETSVSDAELALINLIHKRACLVVGTRNVRDSYNKQLILLDRILSVGKIQYDELHCVR